MTQSMCAYKNTAKVFLVSLSGTQQFVIVEVIARACFQSVVFIAPHCTFNVFLHGERIRGLISRNNVELVIPRVGSHRGQLEKKNDN